MGAAAKRQMSLVGFMQAGNTSVYAGSWRHPATEHGFLSASYYQKLGRTLEEGCFDLMFFDDRLAMPGIYGGSVAEAVRRRRPPGEARPEHRARRLRRAPPSTSGSGATYSTTYYSPFHVARTFATLDHLSERSRGLERGHLGQRQRGPELRHRRSTSATTQRYDRADEFLEATTGLWDTWEDDALVLDREAGVFADPDKVHELDYDGRLVPGPWPAHRAPRRRRAGRCSCRRARRVGAGTSRRAGPS